MSNFPGTYVNIVGKDMPIARISSDILPPMSAANDKLFVKSLIICDNQYNLFMFITFLIILRSM